MAICRSKAAALANLLRRLGVRREERVAMIMLDTDRFSDRVSRRDPRRRGAGAAQHAADRRINTPMCWRIAARGCCSFPKRCCRWSRTCVGRMPDLEHVVVAGNDAHGHKKLSDELARESDSFATAATHADEPAFWLYSSGSTGMPKGVRHLHSSLAGDRGDLCASRCSAFARTMSACRRQNCFSPMGSAMR